MKKLVAFAQVLLSLALVQGVLAANIYVSETGAGAGTVADPAGLWGALATAQSNGEDDTIFLQQGTYTHDPGFVYETAGTNVTSLRLSGGWDAAYAVQSDDPALTRLDGQHARRVLKIAADGAGVDIVVTLRNVSVQNGMTNEYAAFPAETGYGAGIYVMRQNGCRVKLVLEGCLVRDNETVHASSQGGAIYTTGDYALSDSAFTGNVTKYVGGAIAGAYTAPYTQALAPTVDECWFEDNRSLNSGGSHMYFTTAPYIRNSVFKGRPGGASSGGGAINSVYGAHPVFEGCRFEGNVSDYWGGAIHLWDSPAEIRNCLFLNNKCGVLLNNGGGGAVTMVDNDPATARTVNIVNSTFVGNLTLGYQMGGAIHNRVQTVNVVNSIFSNNGYVSGGNTYYGAYYALINEGTGTISYSNAQGGLGSTGFTPGAGNIDLDPLFVIGDWDYHIQSGSPGVDAGSNAAVPATLATDFEGDPRVFALKDRETPIADMGWDEYYDGVLEFTAPTAGTFWLNDGSTRTIAWTCQNIGGDVRLYVWQGDRWTGHEVTEIAASVPCSTQTYAWVPPAHLEATDYAVVVDSLRYPTVGHGIGPLTIAHLRVTSPNGGQSLVQGSTYNVTWQSGNLPGATIAIQLYSGLSPSRSIALAAPNTGTFSWKVPYTQPPGTAYRIRILVTSPNVSEDWSDAAFRILPAVTLTAPNGGQRWKRGLAYKVTWTYRNAPGPTVRLDLYKGAALSRTIVASAPVGVAGKGSYLWRIPATQTPAATYTIRVRSTKYPSCFDFSNKVFTITK